MDATAIATIASATVSLLVPYLKSLGDELAKKAVGEIGSKAGGNAWNKAARLYTNVKTKFLAKPETAKVLNAFQKTPDDKDMQVVIGFHLKDVMETDDIFAHELAETLKQASDADVDSIFNTTIYGDVQKLVQIGTVYGNVKI